ncbi:MAG: hypothetical protein AB1777_09895 [Bacteroidota bacterium]
MNTIEISRPKTERYYTEGKIKILIDGQQKGAISQGESLSFELPEGNHTIRATTTFKMGSSEIFINNLKGTSIEVSVNPNFNFTPIMVITIIPFFLIVFFNTIVRLKCKYWVLRQ